MVNTYLWSLIFRSEALFSMNKPFPQSIQFDHCMQPSHSQNKMTQDIHEYYEYWKDKYLTPTGSTPGGYYIKTTGSTSSALTVSEAHGYGMMTFALMAGSSPFGDPDAKKILTVCIKSLMFILLDILTILWPGHLVLMETEVKRLEQIHLLLQMVI